MAEYPETADGTLVVMVCRARHLPNRRKLDKQSPYVLLRLNTVAKKTPALFRAGQTPEWTHEIRFQLSRDRKPIMRLDVLDETKSDPTPIGGTEIDCLAVFLDPANLQESGKYILDGWHDLSFKDKYAGKIFLEMTFYPSAPVPPPKLSQSVSSHAFALEPAETWENEDSFRRLAPAAPQHSVNVSNDVFVASPPQKTPFFRSSDPEPRVHDESVFVESPPKQKTGRLAKLKDKFMAKEPITGLWAHDNKVPSSNLKKHSHTAHKSYHEPSPLDNLDDLLAEIGLLLPPPDSLLPVAPPPPPPHSVSGSLSVDGQRLKAYGNNYSPARSPEQRFAMDRSGSLSPTKTRRKPPPDIVPPLDTTSIPFSAENFQLDADEPDLLPTKVYHMDQPVKSLTVMATDRERHALNPNEIDPRYYAPTPSEHLSRSTRLQGATKRFEDSDTQSAGYLGEGTWNLPPGNKFSPSVFQRINTENENDDDHKPPVPPKIPAGLSEKEYYVLDKDSYLKDINGRRF